MKAFRIFQIVVLIGACLLGTLGSGAVAASENSSVDWSDPAAVKSLYEEMRKVEDVEEFFADLSPEAQEALIEAMRKVTYETATTVEQIRSSGHIGVTHSIYCKGYLGETLWEYHMRIEWSYDGVYITGIYDHHSWGVTYWGYQYEPAGESESGGQGYTYFHRWSQGRFWYEIYGFIIYVGYPWIDMTVYGDGTWYSYDGGNY